MASLALGVRFGPVSAGTADFVYSGTVTGYTNPTGLTDGHTYRYRAESGDLSQWEWGSGAWTAGTSTLARTTVLLSSASNSKVSFTAQPQVSIVIFPADVLLFDDAMSLTAAQQAQGRANIAATLRGHLSGLTLSTAGSSATFAVSAGDAADSTNVDLMALAAFTKTTSAWALGTAVGSLDTGSIATATWYHVYLIKRTDTGVVDVLCSLSATAPTMPTSYTLFRRIGAMLTDGSSHWTQFLQLGDEFLWVTAVNDVNISSLGTSTGLFTLSVPQGIQVNALIRATALNAAANVGVLVTSPDETTGAAGSPTGNVSMTTPVASIAARVTLNVRTNVSGIIRAVASAASTTFDATTYGWIDRRGRDA